MKIVTFPRWKRRGRDLRGQKVKSFLGLPVMWRGTGSVVWRKCSSCTGGVQWLNPATRRWGRIPPELRREQLDRTGFPQANIRDCHSCHGVGKHWVPVQEDDEVP